MATEKDKDEKDLGFFNDIRSELVPLIAGLVSFSVLVDQAINHLGKYFGLETSSSALFFIVLYFIIPALIVLFWLIIFNHMEGLKKVLLNAENRNIKLVRLMAAIISLLLILLAGFIWVNPFTYLVLSLLAIVLVLIYGGVVIVWTPTKSSAFAREYRQANYQFGIVMSTIIIVWTLYYVNQITPKNDVNSHAETLNQNVPGDKHIDFTFKPFSQDLVSKIKHSSKMKDDTDSLRKQIEEITKQFTDFAYSLNCDTILMNSFNTMHTNKVLCYVDSSKTFSHKKFQELKYVLQDELRTESKNAKISWANWLRIVQFKGLLLFAILILFLITVWYHAYTTKLKTKEEPEDQNSLKKTELEAFSEINISRISTYFLFLLIIPFFKPIDEEDINFDKPFISVSNPITQIANSHSYAGKTEIIDRPVIVPDTTFVNKRTKELKAEFKRIDSVLEKLKKEAAKTEKPYDTKPTH